MKKWVLSLGLVFSISFIGNGIVNGEESNKIASILQSGSLSAEDIENIEDIIKYEEAKSLVENVVPLHDIQSRVLLPNPILDNWRIGTAAVRKAGYVNTAMYMKHAEVVNGTPPKTHTSNNNAWAKDVVLGDDILGSLFSQVRTWIRSGEKGSKSISGSYAFLTGDKYYALHAVNYSYTLTRLSNGGVSTTGQVTDRYDFEWGKYDGLGGIANNYAVAATKAGVIKPYNIVINAKSQ